MITVAGAGLDWARGARAPVLFVHEKESRGGRVRRARVSYVLSTKQAN